MHYTEVVTNIVTHKINNKNPEFQEFPKVNHNPTPRRGIL